MPLNYSIVLLGNPRKPDDPKKAYARSQVSKELTWIAQQNNTVI